MEDGEEAGGEDAPPILTPYAPLPSSPPPPAAPPPPPTPAPAPTAPTDQEDDGDPDVPSKQDARTEFGMRTSLDEFLDYHSFYFKNREVCMEDNVSSYNYRLGGDISPANIVRGVRHAYEELGIALKQSRACKFTCMASLIMSTVAEGEIEPTLFIFYPSWNSIIGKDKLNIMTGLKSLANFKKELESIDIFEKLVSQIPEKSRDNIVSVESMLVTFYTPQ